MCTCCGDYVCLCSGVLKLLKKSRKRGKNQESIQSSTIPDPGHQWKSNKLTIRYHKREPRGQLFPSRWPQGKRRIFEVNGWWRLPWAVMSPLAKRSADRSMAACFYRFMLVRFFKLLSFELSSWYCIMFQISDWTWWSQKLHICLYLAKCRVQHTVQLSMEPYLYVQCRLCLVYTCNTHINVHASSNRFYSNTPHVTIR